MKLTSKITAVAAFALTMLFAHVAYSHSGAAASQLVVAGALGQADSSGQQDPKALLRMARQAIDQKQFAQADSYIRQAEAGWGDVRFSLVGDTPKKVRRDLDEAQARGNAVTPPSQSSRPKFTSMFGSAKAEPKSDPFKNAGQNVDALLNDNKGKAVNFLKRGRDAQARGDKVGAQHYAKMALEAGATFGPQEDSPQKLWAELTGGQAAPASTPVNRFAAAPTPPPASVEADVRGLGLGSLPSRGAPRQAETAPPRMLPPTSRVGTPVAPSTGRPAVSRAIYDPSVDTSRSVAAGGTTPVYPSTGYVPGVIRQVSAEEEVPATAGAPAQPKPATPATAGGNVAFAVQLIEQGDDALRQRDPNRAAGLFRQAAAYSDELDPATAQRLQDRLQLAAAPLPAPARRPNQLLEQASDKEMRNRQQLNFEVQRRVAEAMDQTKTDPKTAIDKLTELSEYVQKSELSAGDKRQLEAFVQRNLADVRKYISDHHAEIELNETNSSRRENIARQNEHRVEVGQRLADLVEQFNTLRNEGRYAEAVIIGKKARELAPDEAVAIQLWQESRFIQRIMRNREISEEKESKVISALVSVDESSIPFDDREPMRYVENWETMTQGRERFRDSERQRHPSEIEIEKKLRTKVSLKFRETPLSEIVTYLRDVTNINIYLDPKGMSDEGIHHSTPVTIDLRDDISVQSALNLILEPLHLSYVIQNEVLKITSDQLRDSSVYTATYNVADLVIPLPNFAPHNRLGLTQALSDGYDATIGSLGGNASPVMVNASPMDVPGGIGTGNGLAQTVDPSGGFSTGGRGGATNADFDPLIELITTTIEPDSWEEAGGAGRLSEFETNLSLVVSSTQDVHDKIRDLLEQLRRLQDLQVTIEVRFITLNDDFFERIGVDFNFNIDDKSATVDPLADKQGNTSTVGFIGFDEGTGVPGYTFDQDIHVRNGSFAGLIPGGFAGFDPVSSVGTTLGFAILSDIEAFFLIEASQSDRRSNLMQAPKVTLFNGQAASISAQTQKPFVTSVVPVVGDFAAAQAPVIAILPEGTTLSVQAVVSADRRYVRLTLIPFFSEIRDVETFTFTGTSTSTSSSSDDSADSGDTTSSATAATTTTSGTTIQLPEFQFTTVTTTVSVPDGGTVLLGGIKQLTERRLEHGTPILGKLPYISRLFKNVGIGRTTESIMLMVTPRIIIQEEEEMRIGL